MPDLKGKRTFVPIELADGPLSLALMIGGHLYINQISEIAVADELVAVASFLMG